MSPSLSKLTSIIGIISATATQKHIDSIVSKGFMNRAWPSREGCRKGYWVNSKGMALIDGAPSLK
jgi:hypothetical protein